MSNTMMMRLRPLVLSLALGLSAVGGLASAAHAGEQTSWRDKWPQIQAQLQAQAPQQPQEACATQPPAQTTTDASGSSMASPYGAGMAAVNGAGQRIDQNGIPLLQDRGMDN